MKNSLLILIVLFVGIIMAGCAPKYACKETIPKTRCASLTEVYAEQVTGLPASDSVEKVSSQEAIIRKRDRKDGHYAALIVSSLNNSGQHRDLNSVEIVKGMKGDDQLPILRPPKVVRIWFAPWVDSNEDLNMDTYIYTEIRGTKWILGEKTPGSGRSNTLPGNIGRITGALE